MRITFSTKLQNQHQQPHPKVAESENIGANHLGFTKSLFQHYCQHLGLTHNHISAESTFNFYINERIAYLLRTSVNIKSARETFYSKLIQNTNLPINHNFASIITEINKEIEHHTQQRYPITYTSKGKRKLQTPAVTPQKIQPPIWKKTKIDTINISSIDASTSNATSAFGCFSFQSKQRKEDLLGLYGKILITTTLSEFRNCESLGNYIEEEEESEDQEFTYQNPILENLEIKTPNSQTQPNLDNLENDTPNIQTPPNQNNPNPEVINQHLSPVIIIDQSPIEPIGQSI
ncbi:hypothetical protein G9A89_023186 [Geosiphon pyriformis]|nr:hypothetical protein G9A89_023186 [Geosiphon pyriformis]